MRRRIFGLLIALRLACAAPASAQTPADAYAPRHVFFGLGVMNTADDRDDRRGFEMSRRMSRWFVDGAAVLSPRIAIGAMVLPLDSVDIVSEGSSYFFEDHERETAILGTVRVRAARAKRIALDAVAGAGALRYELEGRSRINGPPGRPPSVATRSMQGFAPAFLTGAEMPVRAGRAFAAVPYAYAYFLNRTEYSLFFRRARKTSAIAFGIAARVGW